MNDLVLYLIS